MEQMLRPVLGVIFPEYSNYSKYFSITSAFVETFLGIFLIIPSSTWRKLGVINLELMHCLILITLVLENYNSVVWPWNIMSMIMVYHLYWNSEDYVHPLERIYRKITARNYEKKKETKENIAQQKENGSKANFNKNKKLASESRESGFGIFHASIFFLVGFMPLLSFLNMWDLYLSFGLYTGNNHIFWAYYHSSSYPPKLYPSGKNISSYITMLTLNGESPGNGINVENWCFKDLNVAPIIERRVMGPIGLLFCEEAIKKDPSGVLIEPYYFLWKPRFDLMSLWDPTRSTEWKKMKCPNLNNWEYI
jgi:hypothetical protein